MLRRRAARGRLRSGVDWRSERPRLRRLEVVWRRDCAYCRQAVDRLAKLEDQTESLTAGITLAGGTVVLAGIGGARIGFLFCFMRRHLAGGVSHGADIGIHRTCSHALAVLPTVFRAMLPIVSLAVLMRIRIRDRNITSATTIDAMARACSQRLRGDGERKRENHHRPGVSETAHEHSIPCPVPVPVRGLCRRPHLWLCGCGCGGCGCGCALRAAHCVSSFCCRRLALRLSRSSLRVELLLPAAGAPRSSQ